MIPTDSGNRLDELVEVFLFKIEGVTFGVDGQQIGRITSLEDARGESLAWFHDLLPFQSEVGQYTGPRVIFADGDDLHTGLVIDNPLDIISVPIRDIHPMPVFLERMGQTGPFWGVVICNEGMVFLLDMFELMGSVENKNTLHA